MTKHATPWMFGTAHNAKSDEERRDCRYQLRLSEAEKKAIMEVAERHNMTMSKLLRIAAMNYNK